MTTWHRVKFATFSSSKFKNHSSNWVQNFNQPYRTMSTTIFVSFNDWNRRRLKRSNMLKKRYPKTRDQYPLPYKNYVNALMEAGFRNCYAQTIFAPQTYFIGRRRAGHRTLFLTWMKILSESVAWRDGKSVLPSQGLALCSFEYNFFQVSTHLLDLSQKHISRSRQ